MAETLTRRQFFESGAAPAGAADAQGGSDNSRGGKTSARLLPGCCAYSYRKVLQNGQISMDDFLNKVVQIGSLGADMTAYWFKSTDPGYVDSLRDQAFRSGIPFSGAACGATMVQADPAKRKQVLQQIKDWVDVTERLGAPHLRIFGGTLPKGVTKNQAMGWVVETMKPACEYSGKKGITLGIEDHQGVTQNAEVCLEIMHRVNSPYAGINLDITHFIPTPNQDAYAQIKACIRYATQTHIRDHFDDGKPVDMDRVWKMFADGGYKGFMSAEYEGDDPLNGVPKLMDKIKALCHKYSAV